MDFLLKKWKKSSFESQIVPNRSYKTYQKNVIQIETEKNLVRKLGMGCVLYQKVIYLLNNVVGVLHNRQ